ncbi:cell wall-binding repeat-containing protein [Planococcus maritimus]|uniref:cell wall-binding repeat-containing protein n=1 Tax=Planococcus maritimus TaxID=192421 RepID=UPI00079C1601|nr:cell wall-binding repeat-containing protein [Planococcus maritimus]KYG59421.1 hypothetical protein AY633_04025 [Planococcus maritimus]
MLNLKRVFILVSSIFFLVCISMETNAESIVNVKNFGSIPNDKIDDTQSIQNAIDSQSENGGGIVYFEEGEYQVDAMQSINLKDNITLEFEVGTILKAIPNSAERYEIMKIHDVKNVELKGEAKIVGDRTEHLGSSGEWGFGISIRGSRNILIKDINLSDMWGDGVYIGNTSKQNYSEDIKITNVTMNNNRRQGITIVSAKNLEIVDVVITNTNGTSPQCGIDIEPNNPTQFLENIKIINLKTDNNEGSGLKFYFENFKFNENPISIFVDSISNIKDGFAVRSLENIIGDIEIAKYHYLLDKDSLIAPTVEPVTDISQEVVGRAPAGSFVTVSVGSQGLGKAQANSAGDYTVSIPVQQADALMRVRLSDAHGNYVSNKYITVLKITETDKTNRISGTNRYDTAIEISQKGWNTSDKVILATAADFPDALAGGPLAYKEDAPILLTRSESLTKETKAEIDRLSAKEVIILGSKGAVSESVDSELKKMGLATNRIGGKNRYETAAMIAKHLNFTEAIVAYGSNFPDVLSISAYASRHGIPILLTRHDKLPIETKAALESISKTHVIGSTGVVSTEVFKALPNPVRYGGKNRYDTGLQVNSQLKLGTEKAFIATGMNFPDALAGSVLAAKNNAPILLVKKDTIPAETATQLDSYRSYSIFGGTGAVGETVLEVLNKQLNN